MKLYARAIRARDRQIKTIVLRGTGVSFCTGAHFGESPAPRHIRFAFSGLPTAAIEEGIAALGEWIEK